MSIDTKELKEKVVKSLSGHNWIVTIIFSFIAYGGIDGVLNYVLESNNDDRDNFQIIIDVQRDEISKCQTKLAEKTKNLESCVMQNHALQNMLSNLESKRTLLDAINTDDFPNPYWIKHIDGTMLYMNKAYERIFLKPIGKKMSDYIGRKDADFWPHEIAAQFKKNDKEVVKLKKAITGKETVIINGEKLSVTVTKWPAQVGNLVVGVCGTVYPCNISEWNKALRK